MTQKTLHYYGLVTGVPQSHELKDYVLTSLKNSVAQIVVVDERRGFSILHFVVLHFGGNHSTDTDS